MGEIAVGDAAIGDTTRKVEKIYGTLDIRNPRPRKDFLLIHIPKTAGTSFELDSPLHLPISSSLTDNDEINLHDTLEKGSIFDTVVLLREPVAHVLSQFLECKYDEWGQSVTKYTDFPGYGKLNDTLSGFREWIQHFHTEKFEGFAQRQKLENAFNCYDPWNMQTRYFVEKCGAHVSYSQACRVPPIDKAKNALKNLTVVGLVESYTATLCLMEYHATGNLSSQCRSCSAGLLAVSSQHHHIQHHVPPHTLSMIDNDTFALVNDLTIQDRALYEYAKLIFLEEVQRVHQATGDDLLCRHNPTKLRLQPSDQSFANQDSVPRVVTITTVLFAAICSRWLFVYLKGRRWSVPRWCS